MLKKFLLIITVILISAGLVFPAFAAPSGDTDKKPVNIHELISEKNIVETTEQFLVEFTKPDKTESSTYKKSFTFSGSIEKSDIHVHMARYNNETGKYENFYNVDDECQWVGLHGFIKVFTLKPGENRIKVVAYDDNKADRLSLDDIQVSYFTVNYIKESLLEKALNSLTKRFEEIFDTSR